MLEYSCSTPLILTALIAIPGNEESNILLNELPMVTPKPLSNGCRIKVPKVSVASSTSSGSGICIL